MITPRGQVKVLDFGLAKRTLLQESMEDDDTQIPTQPGLVMGTIQYMSPEQALGKVVDHRSDVFSFGVVLYEMATGRLPFIGATAIETLNHIINSSPPAISDFNPDIPQALSRTIEKCLEKTVERRFKNASDLLNDLRAQLVIHAVPSSSAVSVRNNLPQQLTRFVGRGR